MNRRAFLSRAAATGALAALAGCSGFVGGSPGVDDDFDVGMTHNAFEPRDLEVSVDETVVWGNGGSRAHTVTACRDAAEGPDFCDGDGVPEGATYFASGGYGSEAAALEAWPSGGGIEPGETFEHTFETAGEFPYYCIPHEPAGMVGTVVVTE
jgi:plastocyanin